MVLDNLIGKSKPDNDKAKKLLEGQHRIISAMDTVFPEMKAKECKKEGEVMGVPKKIVCKIETEDAKGKVETIANIDEEGRDTALLSAKIDVEEKSEGSGFW